jgi:hypothetical protein
LADFGRVFQAGITIEASTRNAAESTAQEYLQLARAKPGGALESADYPRLHGLAVAQACDELAILPDSRAPDGTCTIPIAVCIHDGAVGNTACGGASSAACPGFADGLNTAVDAASNGLPYVEVRACYTFHTLAGDIVVSLPFASGINLGDILLFRSRTFVVADY